MVCEEAIIQNPMLCKLMIRWRRNPSSMSLKLSPTTVESFSVHAKNIEYPKRFAYQTRQRGCLDNGRRARAVRGTMGVASEPCTRYSALYPPLAPIDMSPELLAETTTSRRDRAASTGPSSGNVRRRRVAPIYQTSRYHQLKLYSQSRFQYFHM